MSTILRDLYAHQEWADAEHWRAFHAVPAALEDRTIRERLHHIHIVQRAFLWACRGAREAFAFTKPEDFASAAALADYAREYHREIARFLDEMPDASLSETRTIPWFKVGDEAAFTITLEQALTQEVMHSHYHRAQNATRFRELGGEPPLTDYIVWLWRGRPAPAWP